MYVLTTSDLNKLDFGPYYKDLLVVATNIDNFVCFNEKIKRNWNLCLNADESIGAKVSRKNDEFNIVINIGTCNCGLDLYFSKYSKEDPIWIDDRVIDAWAVPMGFFCWVYLHEITHIINGHLAYLMTCTNIDPLSRKALEFDADCTAIAILFPFLKKQFCSLNFSDLFIKKLVFLSLYWPLRLLVGRSKVNLIANHGAVDTRMIYCLLKLARQGNFGVDNEAKEAHDANELMSFFFCLEERYQNNVDKKLITKLFGEKNDELQYIIEKWNQIFPDVRKCYLGVV